MNVALVWRLFRRDLRASEVRVLILALVVAVAAISGVGFLTSRVDKAMERQATELLAADIAVSATHQLPNDWSVYAATLDLQTARTISFPSVLFHEGNTQLVGVKAADQAYPLRGALKLITKGNQTEQSSGSAPPNGEVWVERRLLSGLNLTLGDTITLGHAPLIITGILTYEPDRGADLFQIAPRVMLNMSDLPATQLLSTHSRARYRFLAAGDQAAVKQLKQWLKHRLNEGQSLLGAQDARPEFASALEKAQLFLGLASLGSILLAGAAVALAAFRYRRRQADMAALMSCFGAGQNQVLWLYMGRLLGIGLLASALGLVLGWFSQWALTGILEQLFSAQLPAPDWQPAGVGLLTALLTLSGFALPAIVRLRKVPPLRVLRSDLGAPSGSSIILILWALISLTLIVRWQAGDDKLTLYVLGSMLALSAVFGVLAWLMILFIRGLSNLTPLQASSRFWAIRFGLAGLKRRKALSILQIGSFSIGLTVILLLAVVRVDLLTGWQQTISDKAPNHFLINIQDDEITGVKTLLADNNISVADVYPMIRARLTHINDKPASPDDYQGARAKRLIHKDYNLSYANALPAANKITAGQWWSGDTPQISLEDKMANTLKLSIGDTLRFNIAGESLQARISSLRKVQWDSFQVNFFAMLNPAALAEFPASWVTSVYVPPTDNSTITQLAQTYPTISALDIGTLIRQIRNLIDHAALAVEGVFGFTLLAAIVVFLAAFQAERVERAREIALLRTFGASRAQVQKAALVEFVLLGGLAGFLAAAIASTAGWLLAERVFNLHWELNLTLWWSAILAGTFMTTSTGLMSVRQVLRSTPLQGLKQH